MYREGKPGHKLLGLSGPATGTDFEIGIDLETEIVTETDFEIGIDLESETEIVTEFVQKTMACAGNS